MKRRLLARVAFAALALYAAVVSIALHFILADLERERQRVAEVAQMLSFAKFWARGAPVNLSRLPRGYERIPIDDSTPYWRDDAKEWVLLTHPRPPPESHLRSAPHFSDLVFDGFYALYVDERGRFVDLAWSKP